MKFSVLMSLYNKEVPEYLDECLMSLSSQSLKADEIILVFDGFINEHLKSVVYKYQENLNIKIVDIKKNVGLGKALNKGLEHCQYDYVARMDTDDICYDDRFLTQITYLEKYKNISLLGSSIVEFGLEEKREKLLPTDNIGIRNYAKVKNPFNHMSVVFKKKDVLDCGGYMHHLYMEDYNLWLRMLAKGYDVVNIKKPLLKVRVANGMIVKRRGFNYIKSEIKIFRLKKELRIDSGISLYTNLVIRVCSRLIPKNVLGYLYHYDRKKTTQILKSKAK
ncbi:glycosyltransferase [Rouxiella silvae]|uniref:Glycosyltransferase n=1 Tax=Rouxiella silvae TaxID=1646373 RepID=A0AA41BW67_9GAMM|nr:glycosyltransferase [Rouxiella silvae]KQN43713.1 amylovoran biosynthesis protein AmsE [Serratia sp. Leaf50]MBF6636238.1 glycosyltransferase [Rouxiella silvae]